MKKRIISFVMALVLIFGLFPTFAVEVDAAEEYRSWAQSDSRWGSLYLGSSGVTVSSAGCLVTAVTKLIIQCGLRSTENFNVGTLVNWLNSNHGFSGAALVWNKPAEMISGFSYYGDLLAGNAPYSASEYNDKLISWIEEGYHLVFKVYNSGSEHWVCVDEEMSLETGEIYIMDSWVNPSSNIGVRLVDRYPTFRLVRAYRGGTTPSTYIFDECTYYPCGMQLEITESCNPYTLPCNSTTAASYGYESKALTDKALAVGDAITATALYRNSEGSYWYRITLSDGTQAYVWSERCIPVSVVLPSIENGYFPSRISGATGLKGIITAGGGQIDTVYGIVHSGSSTSGAVVMKSTEATVGGTSYNLDGSDVDDSLEFNKLSEGYYTLAFYVDFFTTYVDQDGELATTGQTDYRVGSFGFQFGSEVSNCTVTFDANGGVCSETSRSVTQGNALGTLPGPSREGYIFLGWFDAASGGNEVWSGMTITSPITVYAHWKELHAVDLGADFYAYIKHLASGLGVVAASDNDAELGTYGSTSNEWHFIQQSDGTYKILNMANGYALDVYDAAKADWTNVWTYPDNNTLAQRWYIIESDDGYSLISACSSTALDVYYGSSASVIGDTLQIYHYNGSAAQIMDIVMSRGYTITFNDGLGTNGPDPIVVAAGESVTIPDIVPFCLDHGFYYWVDLTHGTMRFPGETFVPEAGAELKAYFTSPQTIPWDASVHTEIVRIDHVKNYRVFTITPEVDTEYRFFSSGNGDPLMEIFDSSGTNVCRVDDSASSVHFDVTYIMSGGKTYYLHLKQYGQNTGEYNLTIQVQHDQYTGWTQIDGFWYYYQDGLPVTGWLILDGNKYYLHSDGVMATGMTEIGGKYYFFSSGGVMQTGWQTVNGVRRYFGSDGAAVTQWVQDDGEWYYLSNGAKCIGWGKINGYWYYFDSNGAMQTGWQQINGKWYYFASGGAMQTGWLKDGSYWYYLDSTGAMTTGWVKVGSNWFYMNKSGVMQTGWQKINGYWYYFASGGAMQTGWVSIGGKWYYFAAGGAMQTGWQQINGKWYYFASGGAMQTGWLKDGNYWYYLDATGAMVTGTQVINGKTYIFNSSGVWIG